MGIVIYHLKKRENVLFSNENFSFSNYGIHPDKAVRIVANGKEF